MGCLDIGLSEDAIEEMANNYGLLEAEDMQDLLKPRNSFPIKETGHGLAYCR